jgi:hypothetical protein
MTEPSSISTPSLAQLRVQKERLDEKKRELAKQTRDLSERIAAHPDLTQTIQILQQSGGSKTTEHFIVKLGRKETWSQSLLQQIFDTAGINEVLWPFNREWVVDSTRMKNIRRDWPDHYNTLTDALETKIEEKPYIRVVKPKATS